MWYFIYLYLYICSFLFIIRIVIFFFFMYFLYYDLIFFFDWIIIEFNSLIISIFFLFDWIRLLFISFVLFISSMVIFYRKNYILNDINKIRFILLVFIFIISIIFLIICPNLITILIGWDGLGLVSYCLVIYFQTHKSYNSGILTSLYNRIGDVAILISIALMLNIGRWRFFFYLNFIKINWFFFHNYFSCNNKKSSNSFFFLIASGDSCSNTSFSISPFFNTSYCGRIFNNSFLYLFFYI